MKKFNKKISDSFKKNLKLIMHEQGITQMQLVDLFSKHGMKVPQSTISSWFVDGNLPHDDTFETLCKILHVKETDLIPENINEVGKLSKEPITLEKLGYKLQETTEKLERYTWNKKGYEDSLQEVIFYKDRKSVDLQNSYWKFSADEILAIYNKATELF